MPNDWLARCHDDFDIGRNFLGSLRKFQTIYLPGDALAATYEDVLRPELARSKRLADVDVIELGQRAVAFYEEWYEDSERVVRVLERLLEIERRTMKGS